MKRAMWLTVAFWLVSAGTALPFDTIFTSTSQKPYFGRITTMSSTVVSIDRLRDGPLDIPANEITRITFSDSPDGLRTAQEAIIHADYEKARDALKKESADDNREDVAEEIAFCRAFCATELALSGDGELSDAGGRMYAFITKCPNSFHYLKACELMGDICVELGKFPAAEKYYAMLSQAPWPDYKIRAQVALGRSYLAQDDAARADKAFDDALNNDAAGDLAENQRMVARVGKARCMILTGKSEAAIGNLKKILEQVDEKQSDINGMAYNALGTALRKSGKPKEAIIAFLHVHLIYSARPDLDAEAVANLERLFAETHRPNHGNDMRDILNDKYKNSRWAKNVK